MKTKTIFVAALLLLGIEAQAESIRVLDDCYTGSVPALYTVLGSGTSALGGWSHIEKNESNDEYNSLPLKEEEYRIAPKDFVTDPQCEGLKSQNAILVVKLSDWTRQHSNGLETTFADVGLRFSDLTYVVLDVRVNSTNTEIEDIESLKARYSQYLTDDEISRLDRGKVTLSLTLFANDLPDESSKSFNAEFFLEIDQTVYADKWVRVLLPLDEFDLFTERAYQREQASLDQYGQSLVGGFRINPETSDGNQLRNLLGDSWSDSIPETFKQMSISIRRIDLLGKVDR